MKSRSPEDMMLDAAAAKAREAIETVDTDTREALEAESRALFAEAQEALDAQPDALPVMETDG